MIPDYKSFSKSQSVIEELDFQNKTFMNNEWFNNKQ